MNASQSRTQSAAPRLAWMFATVVVGLILVWLALRDDSAPNDERTVRNASTASVAFAQLSGTVRNSAGQFINAAQVCAYGAQTETQLNRECVATDANGNYQFSLPLGEYSITASAADHAGRSSLTTVAEAKPAHLDFTLDAQARSLAGIVLSAAGTRVQGARVTVLKGDEAIANVVTNDHGEFSASTPSGSFAVKAEADGYGASLVQTVAPTMDVRITLFPGNVVAGKVLLKGVLQPVPNVRVLATSRPDRIVTRQRDAVVQSDAQGNFFFDDLAVGEWMLSVDGPNAFGTLVEPIRVGMNRDVRDITLLVHPAQKVAGRFVVGDDEPCEEGQIQFMPQALEQELALHPEGINLAKTSVDLTATPIVRGSIGSGGTFEIAALPSGDYMIGVRCREHQFADGPTKLAVGDASTDELVFKFEHGLGLTVRVVDEEQQPIPNIAVALAAAENAGWSQMQVQSAQRSGNTNSKGEYRFGGLIAGNYVAMAKFASLNGKAVVEKPLSLHGGSEPEPMTLTLAGGGSIRIHAHSPSGAAISRMLFFALDSNGTRYEGQYSGDGKSDIGPLPREQYRVFAYDNKNSKVALNDGAIVHIADSGTVELDFPYDEPNGHMQGRVTDSAGAPMPGTLIRAVSTQLDDHDQLYSAIQLARHGPQELLTDSEGRFRIDGLNSQGTYDLHVDHPDGLQEIRRGVTPAGNVEITFPAASRIEGVAVDSNGQPLSGFDVVTVNIRTGAKRSQNFSSADGAFTLDNIVPGDLHISLFDNSGALSAERTGRLAAGQSLDIGRVVVSASSVEAEHPAFSEP